MSYKTILLHLDEQPRRNERLEIAIRLAEAFDGHLVGAFAARSAFIPSPALAEVGPDMLEIEQRNRRELVSRAEQDFTELARRGGIRFSWRSAGTAGYEALKSAARCADLVVAGQPEPDDANHRAFIGELLLSAGRPVLLVPYVGRFAKVGQRVFIAWNGSREAARAVADALPFLSRASAVELVEFETQSRDDPGVESADSDIGAFLARQGVKVSISRHYVPDLAIGEQILSRAADHSSDLIVMGAYGHSRMRELVLGGATRTLLESMTVPVLMSH